MSLLAECCGYSVCLILAIVSPVIDDGIILPKALPALPLARRRRRVERVLERHVAIIIHWTLHVGWGIFHLRGVQVQLICYQLSVSRNAALPMDRVIRE